MKIKDIAKELHLSISTVSKALNGAFDVSKETKEMVVNYAKANGYKPKEERINLKNRRRLCVLFDNIDACIQSNILYPLAIAFSKAASFQKFEAIYNSMDNMNHLSYDDYMSFNKFDGAFVLGTNYNSSIIKQLSTTKIPTVVFDNSIIGEKIATLNTENINTITKVVSYLTSLNHQKIGFIHGDKNSFVSNERFAGYIIGLMQNDIPYDPNYVYFGEFTKESGMDAAKYFKDTDVTAVVCSSDTIAVGLIKGLEDANIRIPEDISVTGYDDLDISKFIKPSLTTIRQDIDLIGETALQLLTSLMMNRSPQRMIISGDIIKRESTKNRK